MIACDIRASRLGALVSSLLLLGSGCAHQTETTPPPAPTEAALPAEAVPATVAVHREPTPAAGNATVRRFGWYAEVTKMPLPLGDCAGRYTEEARQAGLEGTVVLDIVVGEDGWVRDVMILKGLGHGLSEAAVRALKACRFTPGERDGEPVAVRVPRFKVVFALRKPK